MSDKFVFVKHSASGFYLFRVPSHLELFAGDNVICDTRRGRVPGMCICDSFVTEKGEDILHAAAVDRSMLRDVAGFVGGTPPPRVSDATIPENVEMPIDELLW